MDSSSSVFVEKLVKTFPGADTSALDIENIAIPKGKLIGIIGPDGAGKTTFLRLIAGLLLPSSGSVEVFGKSCHENTKSIHDFIGYMPQKFGLYEDLTVRENLSLYAKLQGIEKKNEEKTFETLLAFSALTPFQGRLAKDLSGGMKQKLGLACALMKKPRLLLLDEPTVGVDPLSRRELWKMVSGLIEEEITVLWSTSYLDEAQKCHEVLLLHEGKSLFYGMPAEMTKKVEKRTFLLEGLLPEIKRDVLAKLTLDERILDATVESSCLRIVLAKEEFLPVLQEEVQEIRGLYKETAPRFEDAFIDVLGGNRKDKKPLMFPAKEKHTQEVIAAKNLTKEFGKFIAVKGIDFTVSPGEIFGLLGPNGAGKSTTFKMLCGLLKPSKGGAFVSGLSLEKASSAARGKVGYMAQKFSLYSGMTVEQNLHFFAGIYSVEKDRKERAIEKMVSLFGFTPFLSQNAGDLPLGFKQRLALSCALMHEPDVLFLDEPTAGVDPLTRREFWMHINSLVQCGMTVMVTTHFMDEAEYCDRIGFILDGKLVNIGPPQMLKNLVRSDTLPDPTLEDAFIILSEQERKR